MYIMHFVFAHQVSGVINKKLFIEHIGSELSLVVCYLMTVIATYYLAGISSRYVESYFIGIGKAVINNIPKRSDQPDAKNRV